MWNATRSRKSRFCEILTSSDTQAKQHGDSGRKGGESRKQHVDTKSKSAQTREKHVRSSNPRHK